MILERFDGGLSCAIPCIDVFKWGRFPPLGGMVEKLCFTAAETLAKPALGGLV
jgi:hypothetical protein